MAREEWPANDWAPPGWWGEYPAWPEQEHQTLPTRRTSAGAVFFVAGALLLVTVVVGYQLWALHKGWLR